MSLCEYKDYFGESGKGVHSYRIFNFAIVDVMMTLNDFRPKAEIIMTEQSSV
jgi:hypothetical protein